MWICTAAPHPSILSVIGVAARETKTLPLDHVDVTARAETMNTVPTQPVMLQIGVVPAYALTAVASAQRGLALRLHLLRVYTNLACISEVHKTQASGACRKPSVAFRVCMCLKGLTFLCTARR